MPYPDSELHTRWKDQRTRTQLAVMAAALLFACSGFAAQLLPGSTHPVHAAQIRATAPAPVLTVPTTHAAPTTTTTRPAVDMAAVGRFVAALHAAAHHPAVHHTTTSTTVHRRSVITSNTNSSGVAQCVKNHESGNYAESSHPSSGSGAYQFIPSTWRSWSVKAGYGHYDAHGNPVPTYSYAYEAPPSVQDAVFNFAVANGGGGNWSMRYGNDPCTGG